jgi:hypothetical protein
MSLAGVYICCVHYIYNYIFMCVLCICLWYKKYAFLCYTLLRPANLS